MEQGNQIIKVMEQIMEHGNQIMYGLSMEQGNQIKS